VAPSGNVCLRSKSEGFTPQGSEMRSKISENLKNLKFIVILKEHIWPMEGKGKIFVS
jgi:hypothetical protein